MKYKLKKSKKNVLGSNLGEFQVFIIFEKLNKSKIFYNFCNGKDKHYFFSFSI